MRVRGTKVPPVPTTIKTTTKSMTAFFRAAQYRKSYNGILLRSILVMPNKHFSLLRKIRISRQAGCSRWIRLTASSTDNWDNQFASSVRPLIELKI
jgi:hypothetical protein